MDESLDIARHRETTTVHAPDGREERLDEDLATVVRWLREYVGKPSPDIGRTGPVCPFVPPALDDNAMRFSFHYQQDCLDTGRLRDLLVEELRHFDETAALPGKAGTSLASLLVVFPDAGAPGWAAIDEVYPAMKEFAVDNGLMVGQFHPNCDERAVRNPLFPVSRSPIGLLAVRRLAPHDVLFLHSDKRWFDVYEQRFGAHLRAGKVRDALMQELHANALERFTA